MKLGDTVKFVNEEGTAIIKELRKTTLILEDQYGFTNEYSYDEVLPLDHSMDPDQIEVMDLDKEGSSVAPQSKKTTVEPIVIDLHFGQLVDYPKRYDAHEKLHIQIQTAKEALSRYRKPHQKLILIHGKGKGVLEQEILKLLQQTPQIKYKDADFQRYKLGAVEIEFI